MARLREFDKEEVLERAMLLFWAQGYEATSVRDLNAVMGISSSSMYEFFGDKRAVFLAALARFCAIEQARILQMAKDSPSPQAFVGALFNSIDDAVQAAGRAQGSFAFNTMVELGTRDADVTTQLLDHYFKIVEIVADVFTQAQALALISNKLPPLHLAYTVLSALQGVASVKSVQPDFMYRDAVTQTLLTLLDP